MPLIIPENMPAYELLKDHAFIMGSKRAKHQDIRPQEILIINLMPKKIETENQILSLLANSALQVNITLLATATYVGKNTSITHLEKFYKSIKECKKHRFDGAIVTGAPVEQMDFEKVAYWEELLEIFDFLRLNVTSTVYICWGAMAALKHFYGVDKICLNEKIFGVYKHDKIMPDLLLTNLDEKVLMPHSRHSSVDEKQILCLEKQGRLKILLKNKKIGPALLRDEKDIFILGHLEYFKDTLHEEYLRDNCMQKAKNYYDKNGNIKYNWRSNANTIFSNWLNYDVYQSTPFVL
ncbi:homoserine O-succinyltransferase [Campylobacter sp. VicNov18]|uniref:homoserine O-acetyltransferase/O-succinyltransferase family protein n=1 Tax=Campylobacter bilis TaxID=2691918 RepID=UPI00130E7EEE|nr:homoserine O-succinyltransferase [Campylobacter bilis]MPV64058.1 homoserine O-succinyltransferase [Campylobacter hepaticus]MBM0637560.1 homoserine O-succinyltransferase [Campylobacter bilis]MCC8278286.1 homoserine O-succinyltransferase [Campylobacter bilis]MCC8299790.1 homoserine O-succinyltransferase [Campylobacter bilis]MCC8301195.1 homoserine O-succinyltransferase [Campylobacter bilis]